MKHLFRRLSYSALGFSLFSNAFAAPLIYSESLTQFNIGNTSPFSSASYTLSFEDVPTYTLSDATFSLSALGDFGMSYNTEYLGWRVENTDWFTSFNFGGNDFASIMTDTAIIPMVQFQSIIADGRIDVELYVPSDVDILSLNGLTSFAEVNVNFLHPAPFTANASLQIASVPLPASIWLITSGMVILVAAGRRKNNI